MTTSDTIPDEPRVAREPQPDELAKAARAQFWKRVAQAALVCALVLTLAFSMWTLALIRATQVDNRTTLTNARDAATAAARTANRVEDCTTPGGDCYERGQRQTSGAVAGINTITVRATACLAAVLKGIPDGSQVNVDDVATQIQQCIRSTTAKAKPQAVTPAPVTPAKPKATTRPKGGTAAPNTPQPSPPLAPASPVPTAVPSPTATPSLGIAELTCILAPMLCPRRS